MAQVYHFYKNPFGKVCSILHLLQYQAYGGESSEVENILMGSTRMGSSYTSPKLLRPSTIIGLTSMGSAGPAASPSGSLNRGAPSSKQAPAGVNPSHLKVESLRNLSPPTYRNSPKFEIDMHDLSSLPPAPAFKNVPQRRVSMNYSPFSPNNNTSNPHGENNT